MVEFTIEAPRLFGVTYVYGTPSIPSRPFAWFTSPDDANAFLALLADTEPGPKFEIVEL